MVLSVATCSHAPLRLILSSRKRDLIQATTPNLVHCVRRSKRSSFSSQAMGEKQVARELNPDPSPYQDRRRRATSISNPKALVPGPSASSSKGKERDLDTDNTYLSSIAQRVNLRDTRNSSKPIFNLPTRPKRSAMRDIKVQPSAGSGGIPEVTIDYITKSHIPSTLLPVPQHLLVIIDLNGTLLYRPKRTNPTKFTARPHTLRFLQYCIDTFTVVIWSSAKPENVQHLCDAILSPEMRKKVTAFWGRDKFGLTLEDSNRRVQCYKRLTKVWADKQIAQSHPEYQNGKRWDQTNTVLVDDSFEKGKSEPYNLIEIPEFTGDLKEPGEILPQVHDYLNDLSRHSNVSATIREMPFRAQPQPIQAPVIVPW